MEIKGCYSITPNIPLIEIENREQVWDLHNAAEFKEFSFDNKNRLITLVFDYYRNNGTVITPIQIRLSNVSSFEISPRDQQMPESEDNCLEFFTLHDKENKVTFKFWNGIKIIVVCEVFELKGEGNLSPPL